MKGPYCKDCLCSECACDCTRCKRSPYTRNCSFLKDGCFDFIRRCELAELTVITDDGDQHTVMFDKQQLRDLLRALFD